MDREESYRYVSNRTSLWCPVCGAGAGQGCKPVGSLRFRSHDETALGVVPRPQISMEVVPPSIREPHGNRPKWTPQRWL
jgi:hypothetical protein